MRLLFTGLVLGCAVVIAVAQGQGALTNEAALSRLAGVWNLVDWEETLADGSKRKHPVTAGRIIYTPLGEMCAVVMDPNRPLWESALPTPEEALAGMNSGVFYAYCARAELHAADGLVQLPTVMRYIERSSTRSPTTWVPFASVGSSF